MELKITFLEENTQTEEIHKGKGRLRTESRTFQHRARKRSKIKEGKRRGRQKGALEMCTDRCSWSCEALVMLRGPVSENQGLQEVQEYKRTKKKRQQVRATFPRSLPREAEDVGCS